MKVLHLSNTPLSNAPHNLVTCQNHVLGDSTASLLIHRLQNTNKTFVNFGECWADLPKDEIEARIKSSDLLHFHNFGREQVLFQTYPDFWQLAKKKPRVIQYHSPRYSTESFEDTIEDKSFKHLVIAQYHPRMYPECEHIVPNVIPLFHPRYQGVRVKWNQTAIPLTISYAPSNTTMRGWDNKGYTPTKAVLDRLQAGSQCVVDVITDTPYENCLKRKRWAHIGIDEVMTGSYHLSSLEYLSMECVTIGRLDAQTQAALKQVVTQNLGEEAGVAALKELPWVQPSLPSELETTLHGLLVHRGPHWENLKAKAKAGRAWLEKYWNPSDHVKLFGKIYDSL